MTFTISLAILLAAPPSATDAIGAVPASSPKIWPSFRNDGSSRTSARELPLEWGPAQNRAWTAALPGYGQSAPVIWQDRIYVTSVEGPEKETLHISCIGVADGKPLWKKSFPASQKGRNNPMQSRAAGTPIADASGVIAFFESGDLIALTPSGELRWQRSLSREFGELKNNHGLGSSPAQSNDLAFILVDHQGPSYLLAVKKSDGTTVWKMDRSPRASWSSPVVMSVNGRLQVVVSSNGTVTGYAADTGKKLWELDGLVGNAVPSATMLGDRVVVAAAEGRMRNDLDAISRSNCCLRLKEVGEGQPGFEVAWRARRLAAHYPSPVIAEGHAYFVDKSGVVHCLDLESGDERYAERLDSTPWATPLVMTGRIYFFGKDGVTTVVKTGPQFEKLATNRLWTEAEYRSRYEAAKKAADEAAAKEPPRPSRRPSPGANPGQNPSPGESGPSAAELQAARYSAVGDVVYGVAAIEGMIVIRTGTELHAIQNRQ
jgi:outer membrane protein assembly factor BamB